jgi:hypothetical protein
MPNQYEFIRRFEEKAANGQNYLFAAPSQSYLKYWFRELFEYLEKNRHENHTPDINRSQNVIRYKGATLFFRVFENVGDVEKMRGINLADWFETIF